MTSFTQSYIIKLLSYSEAVLWFIKSYLYYGSLQVTLGGGGEVILTYLYLPKGSN